MGKRKSVRGESGNPAKRAQATATLPTAAPPNVADFQPNVEAMQQKLIRAHEAGFKSGFSTGYTKAMEDLFDEALINATAVNLFAVHRSPKEQVQYVMSIATKVLRPKTTAELMAGLETALRNHYAKIAPFMTPGIKTPPADEQIVFEAEEREEPPPGWERVK